MTRWGYVRVASPCDDDSDQQDALQRTGVRRATTFTDVADGSTPASSRPGWRMLLDELHRGDTVVVASVRALGEDCTDVALTLGALEQMGVGVHAVVDGFDTSQAPGPTLEALATLLGPGLVAVAAA